MDKDAVALWKFRLLSFLRAHFFPIVFWPALGVAIGCVAWFVLLRVLNNEKYLLENQTRETAAKLVQTQATQANRNLTMIDQMLKLVRMQWKAQSGTLDLAQVNQAVHGQDLELNISVFDANGILLGTNAPTTWSPEEMNNIIWMPFFAEQKNSGDDSMFIGMPRKLLNRAGHFLRFSRKIVDEAGVFSGLVVVVLDNAALVANYDASALGKRGFVASLGTDGVTRAYEGASAKDTPSLPPDMVTTVLSSPSGSILLLGNGSNNSRNSLLSWLKVDGYPLVTVAAVDQTEQMLRLNDRREASVQTAVGATIALAGFVIIATILAARFSHGREHLHVFQNAYRKATESGSDGFFIFKPVRQKDGTVLDYLVIDCNERGAEFLDLTREYLVGATLTKLQDHRALHSAQKLFTRAMKNGAVEELLEDKPDSRTAPRYISLKAVRSDDVLAVTARDVTLEKSHAAYIERKNHEDALTNLPNRAWVRKALPDMLARAEKTSVKLAVLFIDLDGFKLVNDTFGHAAGDEVLQIVAKRLIVAVRPNDHVVRLGGDEFVVVLENIKQPKEAEHVAGRILHSFQTPCTTATGISAIGTSIGISVFPDDASDVETLFRHADIAMYEVKTTGKNRFHFFDPAFFGAMQHRLQREKELKTAILEGQFVMHYQARVDSTSKCVSSLEALVRWNHPVEGLLGPDEFIFIAEETGLILNLGEHIIDLVCTQIASWSGGSYSCIPISINVSSRQFNERDIHESIKAALKKHAIEASCVEIELTESTMVKDPTRTAQSLQAIHALGVRLLVDDFGTGYSSLSMLHQMDFDILKVDKSFTRRLGVDEKGEVFFRAIITMAHSLGMRVVAEGVENLEQIKILDSLACDELQGYYLFRPMPASQLPKDLKVTHV